MNPPALTETKVAFFTHCRAKSGGVNVALSQIIKGTRSGTWAHQVNALRRVPYQSDAYHAAKLRLPCFMLSATTATGGHRTADIATHTGLMQIDVDGVGEDNAAMIRDRLGGDPHVLAAWLSPGANGVKGIICIPSDLEKHKLSFGAAQQYLATTYGLTIDPKCSDPSRLCFVSFDPDLRVNPEAVPISIPTPPTPQARLVKPAQTPTKNSSPFLSSTSLSASCILHNTCELFQDFPALLPIYDQHVRRKLGTPSRGLRNGALVELVASTFCVVLPRYVLSFAEFYHQERRELFADYPREQWMREAESALSGCLSRYEKKKLGAEAAAIYQALPNDEHTAAFRICHSLAACESEPTMPPPNFFLPCNQLGTRLGMLDTQAWRILRYLEKKGVILETLKGTRRKFGKPAIGSRFRWLLPL
ncbi:MAG: hypothetical protein JNM99_05590 [Verrucomicrobiaceae bacterium]|nr:hypothetical protein [Verrucomicrobiaceae bacterium]